jgi:hypothetical protein
MRLSANKDSNSKSIMNFNEEKVTGARERSVIKLNRFAPHTRRKASET